MHAEQNVLILAFSFDSLLVRDPQKRTYEFNLQMFTMETSSSPTKQTYDHILLFFIIIIQMKSMTE